MSPDAHNVAEIKVTAVSVPDNWIALKRADYFIFSNLVQASVVESLEEICSVLIITIDKIFGGQSAVMETEV